MARSKKDNLRDASNVPASATDAAPIVTATADYERWLHKRIDVVEPDLEQKHKDIASSLFVFLRGAFYRWGPLSLQTCPELAQSPEVLAVGDLHVENFGTWRDAEGRLVWGVNDFDEVARMPYSLDLVRLVTSAILAQRENDLSIDPGAAAAAVLEGYTGFLDAGGNPFILEESHPSLRAMATVAERAPTPFWDKLGKLPRQRPPGRSGGCFWDGCPRERWTSPSIPAPPASAASVGHATSPGPLVMAAWPRARRRRGCHRLGVGP
jgi:hypothetical protein